MAQIKLHGQESMLKKKNNKFIIIFIIVIAIVNISLIFNNNVWCDEAASINLSRCSFGDIIKYASMDFHPPLYYFLRAILRALFIERFNSIAWKL